MAKVELYEAIVVDGAPDPGLPGHIKVQIPELFDEEDLPVLIPPIYPGWHAGGWASVPVPVNPDGGDEPVRVIVARVGPESYRWIGTSQGFDLITAAEAGTRAGARSGDGRHTVYIDNSNGVFLTVGSDSESTENYMVLGPDNVLQAQTADGAYFRLGGTQATVMNSAGDILMLDDGSITLMQKDGVSYLSLNTGDVTALAGTTIQISGGTVEIGDGIIPPIHNYILALTFMADLSLVMSDIVAIGAGIPAGLPVVATNAIAMIASIATSLASGAPYLSTRTFSD